MVTLTDFGHWSATKSERWLHAHRDPGLELVYVANGKIDWDYDGKRVPVAPGEVSFSWPWETHGAVDARLPSVELYWVLIPLAKAYRQPQRRARYHPSLRMDPDEERRSVAQLQSIEHPVVAASPLLRMAFPALVEALHAHSMADPLRVRALILLLLSEVTRTAGLPAADPHDEAATRVGAFIETLEGCCDEPWSLDSMARACGLGRSRFALLLKAVCGDSPIQYLNRVRVARARSMLRSSNATITEIAFACGFSSSQYFSTVFRQFYGEAPRDVRRGPLSVCGQE